MRPSVSSLTMIAISACAVSAGAEPVRVRLTYVRTEAAVTACPDEPTFRSLVAAKLGYDPFEAGGTQALVVELKPQGPEVVGRLSLSNERGEKRGDRTLRSGDTDCFELASSMALAAALALDPEAVRARGTAAPAPAPAPDPAPPAPPTPPAAPPPAPPVPPDRRQDPRPDRAPIGMRLTAGFVVPAGIVPAPRGGVRGGLGLDAQVWSVAAEGAFLFPSSVAGSFGEVSASVAYGSLVPCAHPRLLSRLSLDLCAVGSVGAMFSDATGVDRARPLTDLFVTVGPRAGLTVMPWDLAGFAASFDVPITLSRVHLVIDQAGQDEEVWTASRIGFVGGLSLVLFFR